MLYQVVEKDPGTDWAPVRYFDKALTRFDTKEAATKAAIDYLTDRNCNNALADTEMLSAAEVFMNTEDGILLGVRNGKNWYLQYPKDGPARNGTISYKKGEVVKDKNYFSLEGKSEVAVRELPGS